MRKIKLTLLALTLALSALAAVPKASASITPICPPCNQIYIGYKCCIQNGTSTTCIPEWQDCAG